MFDSFENAMPFFTLLTEITWNIFLTEMSEIFHIENLANIRTNETFCTCNDKAESCKGEKIDVSGEYFVISISRGIIKSAVWKDHD